ncbi:MAG: H-NS histone family protein [Betaproteobacteria bacterium]|nr:H-NS histone family protein [Pseudomonadota bacterium]NCZ99638.1 H-NS histone family protein [Betaproteobacteria bacterium]NDA35492.1 H-NS histone family protein [Betaproteobacteria bacterium]
MARMSYETIQKQIQKLQAQAKKLEEGHQAKKLKAVAQVRALMKKLGVSISDLDVSNQADTTSQKRRKPKPAKAPVAAKRGFTPVPPKYQHPETKETWTGRGKAPRWLAALISEGHKKEDFLIGIPDTADTFDKEGHTTTNATGQ